MIDTQIVATQAASGVFTTQVRNIKPIVSIYKLYQLVEKCGYMLKHSNATISHSASLYTVTYHYPAVTLAMGVSPWIRKYTCHRYT